MKLHIGLMTAAAVLTLGQIAPAAAFSGDIAQALQATVSEVENALSSSGLPAREPISLLLLSGDRDRYVEGLLKNAVTAAGLTYVEGTSDPVWDEILRQVEWDERKEDILDPATLTAFGRLKATRLLLYGTVRSASKEGNRIYVELELHVSSIETKQHLWGRTFARRTYVADRMRGIVALDEPVRALLRATMDAGVSSLRSAPKLGDVRSVAVLPLGGDIDRYVTGLAQDMLSETDLYPKELDVPTLAEARALLQDQPEKADAVLYGAVRDLSETMESETFDETVYKVSAEVQLRIQSVMTGDVLWSETLAKTEMRSESKDVGWDLWIWAKDNPTVAVIAAGVVVVVFGARALFKAAQRPR